jgi:putative salt-induced outer membrane protein YdiY
MMCRARPNQNRMCRKKNDELLKTRALALGLAGLMLLIPAIPAGAVNVVVQLRNGDRITGTLVAQETNHVVITTSWAGEFALPIATIGGLRTATGQDLLPPAVAPTVSTAPPASPAQRSVAVAAKPAPPGAAKPKRWRNSIQVGSNLAFGARDSQTVFTRVKSTYEHPFPSDAKKFFRTTADYLADYGETENVQSANRMNGGSKTDLDLGKNSYAYAAASTGFDEVRKIDFQYEIGPGLGFHLIKKPTFTFNVESGVNYQGQQRSAGVNLDSIYWRLGEDFVWKITPRLSWSKKFEFFLDGEDAQEFRFRLDSNLNYELIKNLSLILNLTDTFDTEPAVRVNKNELQIRSAIGITF